MLGKPKLLLSVVLTTIIILILVSDSVSGAKKPAKPRNSGGMEFHLTCTVLVNGTPGDSDDGGGGDDEEEEDPERRKAKPGKKPSKVGRRKRSVRSLRVKRAAGKVQLLCDIDNPKGQEVARRSIKSKRSKKGGKGKKPGKGKMAAPENPPSTPPAQAAPAEVTDTTTAAPMAAPPVNPPPTNPENGRK